MDHLLELCGLKVSDTTIRELSQTEGPLMAEFQRRNKDLRDEYKQAAGETEFLTDGVTVNTVDGWQEMKIALFVKRELGEAATPDEWDDRTLPRCQARVAFAAIEASDQFGARWDAWAGRLGIRDYHQISVLADGAKWIWEEVQKHLLGAAGVLDVYHAREHVVATGKLLYGDSPAATAWSENANCRMLAEGWAGMETVFVETRELFAGNAAALKQVEGLRNYLGNHTDHLNYKQRLAEGRPIGSGQIEGACKNCIGRRLKQTGARWRVQRLNRMASVCCLAYSHAWKQYWAAKF